MSLSNENSSSSGVKWTQVNGKSATDTDGTSAAASLPCARSSHGISYLQKFRSMFLYGGEHVARTPLDDSQAAWLAKLSDCGNKCEWSPVATSSDSKNDGSSPPHRIAHAQACVGGDTVYVFGGRQGIHMSEAALNDMWMWDPTNGWKEVRYNNSEANDVPEARSFHRMVAVGTDLYIFGGCGESSGRLADLYKFDTLTCTWTALGISKLLKGRGGPNLITLNGEKTVAVVSGFAGQETKDGHCFHLSNNGGANSGWEETTMEGLDCMKRARSVCVSSSLSGGPVVIFGGEVDPSERGHEGAGGFENDILLLDPTTGAILQQISNDASSWPCNRGWSDGDNVDDCLYLFGGLTGDDKAPQRLDDFWKLQITN